MSKVVILNGPPGVGKDTLASCLVKSGWVIKNFKDGLYKATAAHYGLDLNSFITLSSNRGLKEVPNPLLGGLSPRQALIHVSEDIMKPQYGAHVFGEQLADAAFSHPFIVVPDGGFKEEIQCVEQFHDITVVRLYRDGCSFDGDSRSYAQPDWFKSGTSLLCNLRLIDGEIVEAVSELKELIRL